MLKQKYSINFHTHIFALKFLFELFYLKNVH